MEDQTSKPKAGFFQNDRLLVCSMLVFYGICFLGLVGALFWGVNRQNQAAAANATATGAVIATERAQATATALARFEEQEKYEFIERFDAPSNHWIHGPEDDSYWTGDIIIQEGVYVWRAERVKKPFLHWANFYKGNLVDFDTYVDVRFVEGQTGDICAGFVFRKSHNDWEDGAYTFTICNNSRYGIFFYEQEEWDVIANDWAYEVIHPDDWNRLEISARGYDFSFHINNEVVFEMTDSRQQIGGLAILFEINQMRPAEVWFDNFGFQSR